MKEFIVVVAESYEKVDAADIRASLWADGFEVVRVVQITDEDGD